MCVCVCVYVFDFTNIRNEIVLEHDSLHTFVCMKIYIYIYIYVYVFDFIINDIIKKKTKANTQTHPTLIMTQTSPPHQRHLKKKRRIHTETHTKRETNAHFWAGHPGFLRAVQRQWGSRRARRVYVRRWFDHRNGRRRDPRGGDGRRRRRHHVPGCRVPGYRQPDGCRRWRCRLQHGCSDCACRSCSERTSCLCKARVRHCGRRQFGSHVYHVTGGRHPGYGVLCVMFSRVCAWEACGVSASRHWGGGWVYQRSELVWRCGCGCRWLLGIPYAHGVGHVPLRRVMGVISCIWVLLVACWWWEFFFFVCVCM